MVCGNNPTLMCKFRFYHSALGLRAYRQGMHLSLSQLWKGCECSLSLRCFLLQVFFIFLGLCAVITSHHQFKLWYIVTPEKGQKSPEPGLTEREASVPSRSIPFCPHLGPIFFLYLLWKGERVLFFCMKIGDLNAFSITCMATSNRWDKYILSSFLQESV